MASIGKATWLRGAARGAAVAKPLIAALAAGLLLCACGAQDEHPTVYVLNNDVVVDLAGGGYATITVGLEVQHGTDTAEAQTGVVREIVAKDLAGIERANLLDGERREFLKLKLARDIRRHTDIALDGVLLTDLTLQ